MRSTLLAGASFVMSALLLGGCGGGGGGGSSAVPAAVGAPVGQGSSQTSTVSISLAVPAASASSTKRSVKYVSASTKSMAIGINGAAPVTANCTTSCSANLSAPIGSDTFTVALYDGLNGTGSQLSSGSTTSSVVAGKTNALSLVVGGVVASVTVSLQTTSITVGAAATIPVGVVAKDADGNIIIGTDPFTIPITLSDSDTSSATKLSTTSVTTPSTAVTLSYNGASLSSATITPAVSGVAASALTPAQVTATAAASSSNVPSHVQTMLYYGLDQVNTTIPATFMAAHADFAESDGDESPTSSTAFKAAGGRYTFAYTDPNYVPYCSPPFTSPAGGCQGPIGNENPPESAWMHGADGARINHYVSAHFLYQDALNPTSVDTQNDYHTWTEHITNESTQDFMEADDSGDDLNGGNFYGFNEPETDVTTDAAFLAGRQAVFAASDRPVIINGSGSNGLPAYNGAYLKSPNVIGQMHENCFDDESVGPENDGVWETTANSILANISYGKYAICMSSAAPPVQNRVFFLASWWMVYDPVYSVIAPVGELADGYAVYPEMDIVPTQPLKSATTSISALHTGNGTGVFVREFGACYQATKLIGRCAAIVNTETTALAIPSLSGTYTRSLTLNGNSTYTNGTATWTAGVPSSLPPSSAVIVLQ